MTRLILSFSPGADEDEREGSKVVEVIETFDEVIDHISPINHPTTSLEARGLMIYHTEDNRRLMIHPNAIILVEEM